MALIKSGICKIDHLNNDGDGVPKFGGREPIEVLSNQDDGKKNDCRDSQRTSLYVRIGDQEIRHSQGLIPWDCIPLTLEGEEVEYEIHKYRNNSQIVLKNIISHSPHRTKPKCEYFGKCGGCSLQHMNEAKYQDFKTSILQDDFFKTHLSFEPAIISPNNNKRRRLNLVFAKKSEDLLLGLYKANSNNIISISNCIAAEQEISDLIMPLKNLLNEILLEKQKGEVFILKATNGIDIKIYVESERNIDDRKIRRLSFLAGFLNVIAVSFYLNRNLKWSSKKEDPFVKFGSSKVGVSSDSFLQPTADSDNLLSSIVLGFVEGAALTKEDDVILNQLRHSELARGSSLVDDDPIKKSKMLNQVQHDKVSRLHGYDNNLPKLADLFCGRGTYSIPLAEAGYEVDGYEFDDKAIENLKAASKNLPIKVFKRDLINYPVAAETSLRGALLATQQYRQKSSESLRKPELASSQNVNPGSPRFTRDDVCLNHYSCIIINPPRTGAEKQCIELTNSNVEKIIYVSCSIETFKRDAKILLTKYKITKLIGVDQFKWTKHLEVACCFEIQSK